VLSLKRIVSEGGERLKKEVAHPAIRSWLQKDAVKALAATGFASVGASLLVSLIPRGKHASLLISNGGIASILAAIALNERRILWTANSTRNDVKRVAPSTAPSAPLRSEDSLNLDGAVNRVIEAVKHAKVGETSTSAAVSTHLAHRAKSTLESLRVELEKTPFKNDPILVVASAEKLSLATNTLESMGYSNASGAAYDAEDHPALDVSRFSTVVFDVSELGRARYRDGFNSPSIDLDCIEPAATVYVVGSGRGPLADLEMLETICVHNEVTPFVKSASNEPYSEVLLLRGDL